MFLHRKFSCHRLKLLQNEVKTVLKSLGLQLISRLLSHAPSSVTTQPTVMLNGIDVKDYCSVQSKESEVNLGNAYQILIKNFLTTRI